jgi:uncharacterized protein YggT (Ycf19 family)
MLSITQSIRLSSIINDMRPSEEERWERVEREVPPDPRADPLSSPAARPGEVAREEVYTRGRVVRGSDQRFQLMIWYVVAVIDSLIAIRFFMKLLGASYQADFVRFMYGVTAPLVAPFRGIFQPSGSGNYVLEPESLIAIVIYLLIGWGLVALVRILATPRSRPTV